MAYDNIYGSDLDDASVLNSMYGGFGDNIGQNLYFDPVSQPTSFGGQDEAYLQSLMDARYLYDDPSQQGVSADEFSNDYLNVGDQSQGWMDALGGLGSKALNWLGSGTNARDLAGLGLGALGMYGNYRAGQDQRDDARGMSEAELALRRELGLGQLGIADRGMGIQENQFRLGSGLDDMASKALGMQLLINRGRMTADQTNPWLNFMFTGREQMFKDDPVIGNAFKVNPFTGQPVGIENTMPGSANEFFRGLDPLTGRGEGSIGSDSGQFSGFLPAPQGGGMSPRDALAAQYAAMMTGVPTAGTSGAGSRIQQAAPSAFSVGGDSAMNPSTATDNGLVAGLMGGLGGGTATRVSPYASYGNQITISDVPKRMAEGGGYDGYAGGPRMGALGLLRGGSPGQADNVNANLSHGEYVWDADVVAALGDGNTEAGAAILDQMRERIRAHKRSAPSDEIPPPAKDPMAYLGEV